MGRWARVWWKPDSNLLLLGQILLLDSAGWKLAWLACSCIMQVEGPTPIILALTIDLFLG